MIAASTVELSQVAAAFVDSQVCWCANRVTPAELSRLLDQARVRYMPALAAKLEALSLDQRHVTFDTDQVGFDGTMHVEAALPIPDALALSGAVTDGAVHLAAPGSTDTINGRRAKALGDLARTQLALGYATPALSLVAEGAQGRRLSLVEVGAERPSRDHHQPITEIVLHAHLSADSLYGPAVPGEVPTARIEERPVSGC